MQNKSCFTWHLEYVYKLIVDDKKCGNMLKVMFIVFLQEKH